MNRSGPMRLPWSAGDVPHAVLDILRGCNIRCRDCYNMLPPQIKSLEEIEAQLEALLRLRRLHSVSIVGGEITLHPQLVEIVRLVRSKGLFVELFTNGVVLDERLVQALAEAGTNVIFLHIEHSQKRLDLSPAAGPENVRKLREEKAALISRHGIEAGLSITVYPEFKYEMEEAIEFVRQSPHISYLLATFWRDVQNMPALEGNLRDGLRAVSAPEAWRAAQEDQTPEQLYSLLLERFGMSPFAYLGANTDLGKPRWLSFMTTNVWHPSASPRSVAMRPTWIEKAFLKTYHLITRSYPFYQRPRPMQQGIHLLLNGIAGGGLGEKLRLVFSSLSHGARLSVKRYLFQWPASLDAEGRVVHCEGCPDAVGRDDDMVPLCISDRVIKAKSLSQTVHS